MGVKRIPNLVPGAFRRLNGVRKILDRRLTRWTVPVRPADLRRALQEVTDGSRDILLVHSSLSSCGYFTAGPEDILGAFRELAGTLCLPAHSYCYPPTPGESGPVFDPAVTPSQNGVLTEIFRKQSDVVRSINPTHSLAVTGALARELTAEHEFLDAPCGKGSPWARLVERRASVLLFGVSFHSYTQYHTAEDAAQSPCAYEAGTIDRLRYKGVDGRVNERLSRRQSWTPRRFREAGDLLERAGLVKRVALGKGHLLFVRDSSKVHDFLVERLKRTPDFLYHNCRAPLL